MSTFAPVVALDALTPEWLTAVLRQAGRLREGRVASLSHQTCGTGQLGDSYRFHITYDGADAGPATLVDKFASRDATSREFGRSSGYYRNEIGFYTELAPGLRMSIPTALHAALADNATDFVLLMDDLAPARQVDQLLGCSADESARVLEQAAALHAASWQQPALAARDWLQGLVRSFTHVTDSFAAIVNRFPELCADLVPDADLREAERLVAHADAWKREFSQPRCLWHSDLRADNVLFDAEGGRRPVVVLDWQGLGYGCGSIDVAYWLGTSLTVETRRAHERELVAHYHQCLLRHGVQGYASDTCWDDYRVHALHGLQVGVFGLGAVKRTARGDQMWKLWIERCAAQVRDLDSYTALAARQ